MRSIELFSGCGGLALGTARAGFNHELMVEWNADAFATLALNKANGVEHARDWPFIQRGCAGSRLVLHSLDRSTLRRAAHHANRFRFVASIVAMTTIGICGPKPFALFASCAHAPFCLKT